MREKLLEIGFTDPESKVYLELLAIGAQVASILAKRLQMNRTTLYSVLRTLESKGLVSSRVKSKVRSFSANDPNCLIGYLDRQSKIYEYHRVEVLNLMPTFRSLTRKYNLKKPVVSYFEGLEGVKHVMYDALCCQGDFFAYLSPNKWLNSGLKNFLIDFRDSRIFDKKKSLRAIVPDLPDVRKFFDENYKNSPPQFTQILYLSDERCLELFENDMKIHDDKVAILHLDPGDEYGIVIENKEIANMERKIFEMAWRGLGAVW